MTRVVRAGARIPDHSLVLGVPGRVSELTESQAERPEDPTALYVENARVFLAAGLGLPIPQ